MSERSERIISPVRRADGLGVLGVDHLEWWVGNARQSAGFLASAFGFEIVGRAGPETGVTDRVSYVLRQGAVTFVVTAAITPEAPIAAHHRLHGDGVRDVALLVSSAAHAFEEACRRGAVAIQPPEAHEDAAGKLVTATIAAYGDTVHTFVERSAYSGLYAPGFEPAPMRDPVGPRVGIDRVDHVVANVELGALDGRVAWYEHVFGLTQLTHFDDEQISTEYSALRSTVVWDGDRVVLPINEPAEGRRRSQIQEYLDFHRGPGVQHVALGTTDIVTTVRALHDRGVRLLAVPDAYWVDARRRMAGIEALPWDALQELGILVDRDHDGYLLQVFTETVTDRPTVFFEIIQRCGARGFGEGNFKALFEAIEREQARRGNL